jgi:hypothetical protein
LQTSLICGGVAALALAIAIWATNAELRAV